MKTVLPIKWDGTELPAPKRATDEEAIELVNSGKYVYCPKAFYKQLVLGKPVGVTKEKVLELIQKRKLT